MFAHNLELAGMFFVERVDGANYRQCGVDNEELDGQINDAPQIHTHRTKTFREGFRCARFYLYFFIELKNK